MITEHISDRLVVNTDLVGDTSKCAFETLSLDIVSESLGHAAFFVNVPITHREGEATLFTSESLFDDVDKDLFAMYRRVCDGFGASAEAIKVSEATALATKIRRSIDLRRNMIGVVFVVNRSDVPPV